MVNHRRSRIVSVGAYVPEQVMPNKEFEQFLDTSDERIVALTGIKERHIVPRDQQVYASELGSKAAQRALKNAGLKTAAVDGIICATFTPDSLIPSTACRIQATLGCQCFAFDVSAACAGFVYALTVANSLIISGQAKTILVIGAEVISKTLDWSDRTTCILFGDGAGAVVLSATEKEDIGILATHMGSDGTLGDILKLPLWIEPRTMSMKGHEVFKHAVRMMSDSSMRVINSAGITVEKVSWVIPHQANIRIIQAIADHLKVPFEKVVTNVHKFGNTSAASIPIALNEHWSEGKIQSGDHILMTSLGGGVTVASAVIKI